LPRNANAKRPYLAKSHHKRDRNRRQHGDNHGKGGGKTFEHGQTFVFVINAVQI
jgi:hypothetical protein